MIFLIGKRIEDKGWWEEIHFDSFTECLLKGAYQGLYIQHQTRQVDPTITEVLKYKTLHNTLEDVDTALTIKESRQVSNPEMEKWLEEGYDHTFSEEEVGYTHIQTKMIMRRKIELAGWFIDFDTLEDFIGFITSLRDFPSINVTGNFDIEPKDLPVLILNG